jgi:hypothetical protein
MECVKVKSPHALFSRALEEALDDPDLLGRKGRKELLPQATVATSTSQAPDYIGERTGKHQYTATICKVTRSFYFVKRPRVL